MDGAELVIDGGPSSVRDRGGEGGIRTPDGLPRTAFPVRRHSPLGDLSARRELCRLSPPSAPVANAIAEGRRASGTRRARGGRSGAGSAAIGRLCRRTMAERVGFEPTLLSQ